MQNLLPRELVNDIQAHAVATFPEISVGFISGMSYHRLDSIPISEVRYDKEVHWNIAFQSDSLAQAQSKGAVRFLVFSRPNMRGYPNAREMEVQDKCGIPWLFVENDGVDAMEPILWGKGGAIWPLVGRPFRHGVTDCYALLRDYFIVKHQLVHDEFYRDWFWWDRNKDSLNVVTEGLGNLYEDNFRSQGWSEVPGGSENMKPSDCALLKVHSPIINHVVINIGDGLMLHHVSSGMAVDYCRISCVEKIAPWLRRFNPLIVRHHSLNQD